MQQRKRQSDCQDVGLSSMWVEGLSAGLQGKVV